MKTNLVAHIDLFEFSTNQLPRLALLTGLLPADKMAEAEAIARQLLAPDKHVFPLDTSSKVLSAFASELSKMNPEEMKAFIKFFASNEFLMGPHDDTAVYVVHAAAALIPPMLVVPAPEYPAHAHVQDEAKNMYCLNVIGDIHRNKRDENTFVYLYRRCIGSYNKLTRNEVQLARGFFMNQVSGNKIPKEDLEWYGDNWKDVSVVMGNLASTGDYSRKHAEELIAIAKENGTALIDGML